MPYDEFLGWQAYFEKRPVGWRDDDRTFKLMQVQGVKQKAHELFPALGPIYNAPTKFNEDGTNMSSLKGSQLMMKMLNAVGGDKLEL